MATAKNIIQSAGSSLLNSYAMVFFSKNRLLASVLLLISFFDPIAGLSGLVAVSTSNLAAWLIGLNRFSIRSGIYGFNALLVGLGIGISYQFTIELLVLIIFSALLTLFLTLFFEGVIGKYGLPFLTLPFLISFWMVVLAARHYTELHLSERGIYTYNEFYNWGGMALVNTYNWFNQLEFPFALSTYFKSLSAIFFQYHLLPGILIAIGLLYYSRIAFTLSLIGFYSAYLFYHFIGANFNELNYSFIGFNFILTAIAVGGFFIISSPLSYLWVVLLTPIISILLSSTGEWLGYFQLSTFSFPFNIMVLLFLYMLRFREKLQKKLDLVIFQDFSPEKNLYNQKNTNRRFLGNLYFPIGLPIMGEWSVTQGHDGRHTHQGQWRHAWDFELLDEKGKNHSDKGLELSDFYAYNKPVVAPADGWVEEILDQVEDNRPQEINIDQNWGNTIIIKHLDGLYTKICHLKKGSFTVEKGDYVKKGQKLALCGNSGRSPEPHVHFQVQATPYIGSATLDYPLSRYILHKEDSYELSTWEKPTTGQAVSNIENIPSLGKAFSFVPGQSVSFRVAEGQKEAQLVTWTTEIDIYNYTYLHCSESGAKAYFRQEADIFYFISFYGDKGSLLYAFYLAAFKLAKGYYPGLKVNDEFPVFILQKGWRKLIQDFIAPFHIFIHADYHMEYESMQDEISRDNIILSSALIRRSGKKEKQLAAYHLFISNGRIEKLNISARGKTIEAVYDEPKLSA